MRYFGRLAAVAVVMLLLGGCATSTAGGAVGVSRGQLLLVPAATINSQAAEGFAKLSSAAGEKGKLNNDSVVTTRVRDVANRLIEHVGVFRPEAKDWGWEVNVFDSDAVNAFCMPGGKIGVYTGLLDKLEITDAELAAVMGHEIAHALREHSREKVSQQTLSRAIVRGIAGSGARNAYASAALADVGAQLLLHLPFSREMELESDLMGLELMARAGYDPRLASGVWRKMQKIAGEGGQPEFFSTHPDHSRRIHDLEAAVPKVLALYESQAPTTTSVANASSRSHPERAKVDGAAAPAATPATVPASASALSPARLSADGKDSWSAARLAKTEACHAQPVVALIAIEPGLETYRVVCSTGSVWTIGCDMGNCRVLSR